MENLNIDNIHGGINLIKESLRGKKVLDNVNDMKKLHSLAGNSEWLGPGSRIRGSLQLLVLETNYC